MEFEKAMKIRRSIYNLTGTSPITDERIKAIIADAITYTPSAFHSQSSRVVLLLGNRHLKLWDIVRKTLQKIVPEDKFAPTEAKVQAFEAAHGTILYFEDMATIDQLQKDMPLYADNFPIFSQQSAGMLQYVVWTALAQEGLGASLQHYNPLIDEEVHREFGIDEHWKLIAQMPFGAILGEADALEYKAISERLIVQGGTDDKNS